MPEPTSIEARTFAFEVWPLARILADIRCGSHDWTWEEEWADLDTRHAETGYLDQLEQQIRANGITMPVLIGTDGRLWDGHHRLRIAVRLGINYVPVEVPIDCPQSAAGCRHPAPTCQHGCRAAADELTRLGQDMEAPMPEPTPAELAAEERIKEAAQPNPWDVAFREGARSRDREIAELRDELTKARQGIATPVPPPADVRDQIAAALKSVTVIGGVPPTRLVPVIAPSPMTRITDWQPLDRVIDAVLAEPAIAEALAGAAEVQQLRDLRAAAGIHFGALTELLHGAGIRLPDNCIHLVQLIDQKLNAALDPQEQPHA